MSADGMIGCYRCGDKAGFLGQERPTGWLYVNVEVAPGTGRPELLCPSCMRGLDQFLKGAHVLGANEPPQRDVDAEITRDGFAKVVLEDTLASGVIASSAEDIGRHCYEIADAMMSARGRGPLTQSECVTWLYENGHADAADALRAITSTVGGR
jgi:hypothetical protein